MAATDGAARRDNVEQVYRRVREAILEGEIAPGTVMSQVALADELGVSRTPLREALRMLQSEGLVDAQANRRVTVRPISATDLEELVVMRVALETEAVRLSVQRLAARGHRGARGPAGRDGALRRGQGLRALEAPHMAFHRGLTAPAGVRVNALLEQLSDHAERYRRVHITRSPKAWQTAGHREILDAAKKGDREKAGRLMAVHLSSNAFDVMELLEPGYDARAAAPDARGHRCASKRKR